MPFIDAKVVKGKPECPKCGQKWPGRTDDYGVEEGVGFWFAFQCENCTTSRRKIMVKYVTDYDFKIRGGDEEDVGDGRAEGDSVEWYGSGGGTG